MRKSRSIIFLSAIILLLALSFVSGSNAIADSRSMVWQRWDVLINQIDTSGNVFRVTETHQLQIETGPFNGGDREIPLDRITDIRNIQVFDGDTALRQVSANPDNCPRTLGIVCVSRSNGQLVLYWNFLQQAQSGETRTIKYEYDVYGALRSYTGGDQLWWKALADNRPFSVLASTVTVELPAGVQPQQYTTYPTSWKSSASGNTLTFTSPGGLGTNDNVEVRIQYPHNSAMAAPAWQAAFDRSVQTEPIMVLVIVIIGGLILVGGFLFILFRYTAHKRGLPPIIVPEYLTEPPSNDPPGVIGTLVDGSADTQDVMSTMLDLSQRGFIVIEQEQQKGVFGFIEKMAGESPFVFHRTDASPTGLRAYEQLMLQRIFHGGTSRRLDEMKNTFYTTIDEIKNMLYKEVTAAGYFKQSPQSVRGGWIFAGIGVWVLAGGVGFLAFGTHQSPAITGALLVPTAALGIVGLMMLIASAFMPSRTAQGEQESAKWKAFRNYLKNIRKYTDLKQATDQFDKYIGYAVAFGLDKEWIREFTPTLSAMPTWYYPTYLYGPYSGRYPYQGGFNPNMMGGSHLGGMRNMGGGGGAGNINLNQGLNQASSGLTESLNALNTGLTSLLNSASSVMTSRPSSNGSSGGWSGGGGSGGGSSGGGSAGFH